MIRLKYIFILVFTIILGAVSGAKAQKSPFSGTITYDVSAEGNLPENTKKMMPTVMVYKFSDDKQSMSLNFALAEQKTIFDPSAKTAHVLMELLGKKFAISQSSADFEALMKQEGETSNVRETNETKTIAGFICKKVILTKKISNGTETPSTIYYTDAIDVSRFKIFSAFPEIKGFPLEFSMRKGEVDLKLTARNIRKEVIPSSEFTIGSDYQQISFEELRKFFGNSGFLK